MSLNLILKITVFVLLMPSLALSTNASEKPGLYGVVTDNEQIPLQGATIYIHETGTNTTTDASGYYQLDSLQEGTYHVHIYLSGYKSTARNIRIRNEKVKADFVLQKSVLELDEFVIESTPFKIESRHKSLNVEQINREQLLKHNSGNLAGHIEHIAGISSINMGTGIGKPVIRGLSSQRIAVVDRGIKMEGQQWGTDHGLEIDPYAIYGVEIIKGPSTIMYGSDAGGGVINFRNPPVPKEGILRTEILSNYKSNNNLIGGSALVESNRKGYHFSLRYSHQEYANYKVPADSFLYGGWVLPIYDNMLKNTAGKESNISATLGVNKGWGHSHIYFSQYNQIAGLFPGAVGKPGSYSLLHTENSRDINLPRQNTSHFKVISNTSILLKGNWFEADLGFQKNNRSEEAVPHVHGNRPLPESNIHLQLELETYSAHFRYHLMHSEKSRSIFGLSSNMKFNRIGGYEFLIPEYDAYDAGAYAFQKYSFSEKLILNAGVRYDFGSIDIESFTETEYNFQGEEIGILSRNPEIKQNYSQLSGSAGLSYHPKHHLNFKINIANHFRFPNAAELASNGFHHGTFRHESGNSELNPETGLQLDLSGSLQKKNFLIRLSPFFNYYDNYIYLRPSSEFSTLPGGGQIYRYEQHTAMITGAELTTELHPIKPLHLVLAIDYVYTQNLDTRLPLSLSPPPSLFAEAEYEFHEIFGIFKKVYVNINTRSYMEQNRVDRNERPTPAYTLINGGIGMIFDIKNLPLNFSFQIHNISNKQYLNHMSRYRLLNIPEAGRNFIFTLIIPFNISNA